MFLLCVFICNVYTMYVRICFCEGQQLNYLTNSLKSNISQDLMCMCYAVHSVSIHSVLFYGLSSGSVYYD